MHSTKSCTRIIDPCKTSTVLLCADLLRSLSVHYPVVCKIISVPAISDLRLQNRSLELCSSCVVDIFSSKDYAEEYLNNFFAASAAVEAAASVPSLPQSSSGSNVKLDVEVSACIDAPPRVV